MSDDDIFADAIDGIHGLRRRDRTRLLFKILPEEEAIPDHLRCAIEQTPHLAVTSPDLVEAVRINALRPPDNVYTELLVDEITVNGEPARCSTFNQNCRPKNGISDATAARRSTRRGPGRRRRWDNRRRSPFPAIYCFAGRSRRNGEETHR